MGHADDPQEWLRLNQRYQQMDEAQLLQLRDDFDDLTPIAQEILIAHSPIPRDVATPRSGSYTTRNAACGPFISTHNFKPTGP